MSRNFVAQLNHLANKLDKIAKMEPGEFLVALIDTAQTDKKDPSKIMDEVNRFLNAYHKHFDEAIEDNTKSKAEDQSLEKAKNRLKKKRVEQVEEHLKKESHLKVARQSPIDWAKQIVEMGKKNKDSDKTIIKHLDKFLSIWYSALKGYKDKPKKERVEIAARTAIDSLPKKYIKEENS